MTDPADEQPVEDRAEARLDAVLKETGARDPRDFYRVQLKELRSEDRAGYDAAVEYYRETLLPRVADPEVDPLAAWMDYGRHLASLRTPGRTVSIDGSGRAAAYTSPARRSSLVLHLPDDKKRPALLVGLPSELSSAQRATYDWLRRRRRALRNTTK
mgnify:CR=1 FL=1